MFDVLHGQRGIAYDARSGERAVVDSIVENLCRTVSMIWIRFAGLADQASTSVKEYPASVFLAELKLMIMEKHALIQNNGLIRW